MAAMAYLDEEEVWKCTAHPTKRRRYGVCPACLREKLSTLCPDCAALRPCSCSSSNSSASASSSSASSSSSFSRFFFSRSSSTVPDRSLIGKVSLLIDSEPSFRRSRSVSTLHLPSFLRSRSKFAGREPNPAGTASSFWGKFKKDRSQRVDGRIDADDDRRTMMAKSRSVAVSSTSTATATATVISGPPPVVRKGRSWSRYFPSPMKVFGSHRHSYSGTPLYRG